MARPKTSLLGECGEHYVSAFLIGMGLDVSLTRRNTAAVDIQIKPKRGGRELSLQVKTGGTAHNRVVFKRDPSENYWVWQAGRNALKNVRDTHWYAFVYTNGWPKRSDGPPEIFFVPSKFVAKTLRDNPKNEAAWFWMYDAEAGKYQGATGYRNMIKAMRKQRNARND